MKILLTFALAMIASVAGANQIFTLNGACVAMPGQTCGAGTQVTFIATLSNSYVPGTLLNSGPNGNRPPDLLSFEYIDPFRNILVNQPISTGAFFGNDNMVHTVNLDFGPTTFFIPLAMNDAFLVTISSTMFDVRLEEFSAPICCGYEAQGVVTRVNGNYVPEPPTIALLVLPLLFLRLRKRVTVVL